MLADKPTSFDLISGYLPQIDDEVFYIPEIYEQFIADNRVYFVNTSIESKPAHLQTTLCTVEDIEYETPSDVTRFCARQQKIDKALQMLMVITLRD